MSDKEKISPELGEVKRRALRLCETGDLEALEFSVCALKNSCEQVLATISEQKRERLLAKLEAAGIEFDTLSIDGFTFTKDEETGRVFCSQDGIPF